MERPSRSLLAPRTDADVPNPWLLRVQRKAARIKKQRARYLQAHRRHRLSKATLVGTLFAALDAHSVGALGREELIQFALLTGFRSDREELFEVITILLDDWGSATAHPSSQAINLANFSKLVSRTGALPVSKAELRRTIRYHMAPEIQGALRTRDVAQPQAHEDLRGRTTPEARYLLAPPDLFPQPEVVQRPQLPAQHAPGELSWLVSSALLVRLSAFRPGSGLGALLSARELSALAAVLPSPLPPPFSLPFWLCLASLGVSTYLSVCGCLGSSAWLKCHSMGSMTAWPHHAVHWPSNVSRGPLPDPVPSATPLQTSDTTERVGPTH